MNSEKSDMSVHEPGDDLHFEREEPTIRFLTGLVRLAGRVVGGGGGVVGGWGGGGVGGGGCG